MRKKVKRRRHPTLIEIVISMPKGGLQKRYLTPLQFNGAIVAMDGLCFLGTHFAQPDDEEYTRTFELVQQLARDFTAWGKAMERGVSSFILPPQHYEALLWACEILNDTFRRLIERGKVQDLPLYKVITILDTLKRTLQ